MDSDSDQPCKKRCTEKDKVHSDSNPDEVKVQTQDTRAQSGGSCEQDRGQRCEGVPEESDRVKVISDEDLMTFENVSSNARSSHAVNNEFENSDSSFHIVNEKSEEGSQSPVLPPDNDMNIEPNTDNNLQIEENSGSSSRSLFDDFVSPPDLFVDWVRSQNISAFTKPSQSQNGQADTDNMPSCSNNTQYSRISNEPAIVDDTGEVIPVENLDSSYDSEDDSDLELAKSDTPPENSKSFRIQPSRHTEMTLTFGGTGSRSNMTHTVLLGDGCNSRQSVKYVFNFRSMSDSGTQTDPPSREVAVDTTDDNNQNLYFSENSVNSAESETEESINRLPSYILLQILKNLTMHQLLCRASLVCKTWYNLCRDPDLWRSIDLGHQHKADDNVLSRLTSYSDRVSSISLEDTKILTSHGISLVCVKCKHLQKLKLTRCFSVENDVLMMVGTSCKYLQCLYLDGCYRISDPWTCSVSEGCPQLKELVLSRCSQMTDKGISKIAENCHNLQSIILDHCNKVTDYSVRMLAENCPDLKTLSLANCNITDTGICSVYRMEKLEYLDISNLPGGSITAAVVSQLTRQCVNLECLNLSLNLTVDDRCIQDVVRYGQKMKKLFCVNCSLTDEGLMGVAAHGRTIEKLDLGWCKDVTDKGIWAVTENCPALKYLGLIRCDSVSEKGVEAMVEKYPHIQFSTFFMESRKLIQKAIANGFKFMAETEPKK